MLAIEYHVHIDRGHRSSAAVTPVKYEWDSKNVAGTFCKIKNFAYRENDEWSLSNSHPRRINISEAGSSLINKGGI